MRHGRAESANDVRCSARLHEARSRGASEASRRQGGPTRNAVDQVVTVMTGRRREDRRLLVRGQGRRAEVGHRTSVDKGGAGGREIKANRQRNRGRWYFTGASSGW